MRILFALALIVWIGFAYSDVPPQSPRIKAEHKAEQPPKDQSNAKQLPVTPVVKPSSDAKTTSPEANTHQSREEGTEFWPSFLGVRIKITDSLLVLFTFVLAIFTGFLWSSTHNLWTETKAAGVTAGKSAEAAKTAADAAREATKLASAEFNITHRPKIILRDATSEQDMGELIVVKYILSNVGDTAAKIVAGALGVKVFKGWEFGPDNLPAIDDGKSDIDSVTLKSGEQVNLSFTSPTLRWSGDNDTCHNFLEPEYGQFFSGQLVYEDDAGIRRHTGFRRKFFSDQHRFLRVDSGPHYEYQD